MTRIARNEKFVVGEDVACYAGDTLSFAKVTSVHDAYVKINQLIVPNPPEYREETYVLRPSDGLWVGKYSTSEYIPTTMISSEKNMNEIHRWRFYPSPFALIKRKYFTNSYIYKHRLNIMHRTVLNAKTYGLVALIRTYEMFRKVNEKFRK